VRSLDEPVAIAKVTWRSAEDGGRRSGPPPGPFFAATAVFVHGGDAEVVPDWPAEGEHFSVMLDYVGDLVNQEVEAKVDFIARDLVADHVRKGARFLVMEGRRAVAEAVITETFDKRLGRS